MDYKQIAERFHEVADVMGTCAEATAAMAGQFPELRRVRGFVTLRNGLRRSHWWLVAPDRSIVDPTAKQFESEYYGGHGIAFYEEFNESNPEPTGKCANCGGLIYDGHDFACSRDCEAEYAKYLESF